jgi:hypothetical protein
MRWQKTPVLPRNSSKRFRSAREDTRLYTSRTQTELVVQAARLSRKFVPALPITGDSGPAASAEWTVEGTRARPRCWSRSGRNANHASHADGAVCGTEVGVGARRRKRVLVDCTCVGKGPSCTVGVIRGTKLPIGRARIAASNTVAAARPCPPHCIARRDIECVWHERETVSHRHVKNLARSRWRNVGDRLPVLIDNSDRATRPRRQSRTRVRTWARPRRHPRSGSGRERWRWRCCWC